MHDYHVIIFETGICITVDPPVGI